MSRSSSAPPAPAATARCRRPTMPAVRVARAVARIGRRADAGADSTAPARRCSTASRLTQTCRCAWRWPTAGSRRRWSGATCWPPRHRGGDPHHQRHDHPSRRDQGQCAAAAGAGGDQPPDPARRQHRQRACPRPPRRRRSEGATAGASRRPRAEPAGRDSSSAEYRRLRSVDPGELPARGGRARTGARRHRRPPL